MDIFSKFNNKYKAKPVLVDVDDDFNINCSQIERVINKRTKAIMPVHLNGLIADMNNINKLLGGCLKVIEDSAQAIMSKLNNKFAGTLGDIGCFSMHQQKPWGPLEMVDLLLQIITLF